MTAQINLEETYNELNKLLLDVCSFLNTEVQNGTLSSAATNHAQKLLHRLQKQAEVISQISALQESSNSNYPYLQMQGPGLMEEPQSEYVDADSLNHYEIEDYAPVGNESESISLPPPSSMIIEDYCPYLELPMSQVPQKAVKCGPLIRKERYFIIEQKKQLFVGLVGYWLLIYCMNKKDVKPLQVLNVTEYRAQAKKDPIFEIVGENKKTHEFIAKSAKDMDQWVVAINCKKQQSPNARNLPDIPVSTENSNKDATDNFDKVSNNNTRKISVSEDFESEQDIYDIIDDYKKIEPAPAPDIHDENEEITPTLPARQQNPYVRKTPRSSTENNTYNNVLVNPNIAPLEEDDTYDPVQNGDFEEEDDDIYHEPMIPETINLKVKLPEVNRQMKTPEVNRQMKSPEVNRQLKSPEVNKQMKIPPNEYDNEEDEECYDIPRSDNFNNQPKSPPPSNNYDDYEDEEVEYDELKIIPQNNNDKLAQSKPAELKIDTVVSEKCKPKPVITSPKPKLQGRLDKLTAFSKKSENSESSQQEGNNKKTIHNIIQQMEASLTFRGKN